MKPIYQSKSKLKVWQNICKCGEAKTIVVRRCWKCFAKKHRSQLSRLVSFRKYNHNPGQVADREHAKVILSGKRDFVQTSILFAAPLLLFPICVSSFNLKN